MRADLGRSCLARRLWAWTSPPNSGDCGPHWPQRASIETWRGLLHPDDLRRSRKVLARHFSCELPRCECEARLHPRDGHWVGVLGRCRLFRRTPDRQPEWLNDKHQDVSARRANEEALHVASQEAEAATKAKRAFLANMSHEVRTPLNAMMGLTALLADRLHVMAALHGAQARAKGLQFTLVLTPGMPAWVLGDPTRLEQLLHNLLANAVKFTARGQVQLQVGLDEPPAAHLASEQPTSEHAPGADARLDRRTAPRADHHCDPL